MEWEGWDSLSLSVYHTLSLLWLARYKEKRREHWWKRRMRVEEAIVLDSLATLSSLWPLIDDEKWRDGSVILTVLDLHSQLRMLSRCNRATFAQTDCEHPSVGSTIELVWARKGKGRSIFCSRTLTSTRETSSIQPVKYAKCEGDIEMSREKPANARVLLNRQYH